MEIKVLPNKNIFYLFALLNLIGYDDDNGKPFHLIRIEVRKDLSTSENIAKLSGIKKYWAKNYLSAFHLLKIALFSKDKLADFDITCLDDDAAQRLALHKKYAIYFQTAIDSLKLPDYYETKMKMRYEDLISNLKKGVEKIPIGNILDKFWGFSLTNQGILYPNPLDACYRAQGGLIKNTLTSISGPRYYNKKNNTVEFTGETAVHSVLHEFSHPYVQSIKNSLTKLENPSYKKKIKLLFEYAKNELKSHKNSPIQGVYNKWDSYFNEQVVRTAEVVFLTPKTFNWNNQKSSVYKKNKIENIKNQGFIFINDVVEVFGNVLGNGGTVKEAWVKTIDQCYEKYIRDDKGNKVTP